MRTRSAQQRSEAFILPMVDLFACGFIATIFLFIMSAIQPAIDIEQGVQQGAGGIAAGTLGPVFVEVTPGDGTEILTWSLPTQPPTAGLSVIPNGAAISWPVWIEFAGTGVPGGAFEVALTLGDDTYVALAIGIADTDVRRLSFRVRDSVRVSADFPAVSSADLSLIPAEDSSARGNRALNVFAVGGTVSSVTAEWADGSREVSGRWNGVPFAVPAAVGDECRTTIDPQRRETQCALDLGDLALTLSATQFAASL